MLYGRYISNRQKTLVLHGFAKSNCTVKFLGPKFFLMVPVSGNPLVALKSIVKGRNIFPLASQRS